MNFTTALNIAPQDAPAAEGEGGGVRQLQDDPHHREGDTAQHRRGYHEKVRPGQLQGSARRLCPGCVNAAGKFRQK